MDNRCDTTPLAEEALWLDEVVYGNACSVPDLVPAIALAACHRAEGCRVRDAWLRFVHRNGSDCLSGNLADVLSKMMALRTVSRKAINTI